MKKKIIRREVPHDKSPFPNEIHPLLQKIYASRGVSSTIEVEKNLENLYPFSTLSNIALAVSILIEALRQQQKIVVIGDFDADGATSTVIAVRSLKSFGLKEVDFLVPNRFSFGYGLTPELVAVAKDLNPSLIITVDNGIANHAGVQAANDAGMRVIITDHHLPSDTLPNAAAIINPNLKNDAFPSKNLAGVGVIFYVMLALRKALVERDWFTGLNLPVPNMAKLLDIVALGTIADLVPLDSNNRILVHQGILRMRAGSCVPGIKALLEIGSRSYEKASTYDLGFIVASRLNAAGRMDDMSLGIQCLLTDDMNEAKDLAFKLNLLNEERRVVEKNMHQDALDVLSEFKSNDHVNFAKQKGVCLFDESWHQGVIGILASRIKEQLYKPVIIFALSNPTELKGSARSIPNVHIRDVLAHIAMQYPHLIKKFGGHAQAAGLTIDRESFDQFSTAFNQALHDLMDPNLFEPVLYTDGELPEHDFTLKVAELLNDAGPWGQAFPPPMFDDVFQLLDQRIVGQKHLKLVLGKDARQIDAIAFNIDPNLWPNHRCQQIKAAFRLDINEFRNKRNLQLIIEHLEVN